MLNLDQNVLLTASSCKGVPKSAFEAALSSLLLNACASMRMQPTEPVGIFDVLVLI
jgi:hypothetical protein